MEQNLDNKKHFKERSLLFLKKNKLKLLFLTTIILFISISLILVIENKKKENSLLSEKYLKASLLLSRDQNSEAGKHFEQIILSKNKFYSLLALNAILEKNLVNKKEKILNYFKEVEKLNHSEESKDLILFKKSLYYLKINDTDTGKKILNDLIEKNSALKLLAQEIIK